MTTPDMLAPGSSDMLGPVLGPVLQLGSFGVLVAIIWHILKVQLPALDARNEERQKRAEASQAAFLSALDKSHADCAAERERMITAFTDQLSHARANYRQEAAMQRDHDEREGERLASAIVQRNALDEARRERNRGPTGGQTS